MTECEEQEGGFVMPGVGAQGNLGRCRAVDLAIMWPTLLKGAPV